MSPTEAMLTVLASLSGASAVVIGLSAWLGRVWSNRLMEADKAKHGEQLEKLRAQLTQANQGYAERLRADLQEQLEGLKAKLSLENQERLERFKADLEPLVEAAKWPISRENAHAHELRATIQQLTKHMSAALHSMFWLTWVAERKEERLTAERIDAYDEEMHRLLPEISGLLSATAALDGPTFESISPLVEELYKIDYQIGLAQLELEESRESGVKGFIKCFKRATDLDRDLPRRTADIIRKRIEERAREVLQDSPNPNV